MVAWLAQSPTAAETAREPGRKPRASPVDEKQRGGDAGNRLDDVVQDVVAALVAEDEEDFVVRQPVGGGVPHDVALGGTEARDVGIEAVVFLAGLHQEHALGWNADAGASYDRFQLGHQRRVIL